MESRCLLRLSGVLFLFVLDTVKALLNANQLTVLIKDLMQLSLLQRNLHQVVFLFLSTEYYNRFIRLPLNTIIGLVKTSSII